MTIGTPLNPDGGTSPPSSISSNEAAQIKRNKARKTRGETM
jgi:hypothetical protein